MRVFEEKVCHTFGMDVSYLLIRSSDDLQEDWTSQYSVKRYVHRPEGDQSDIR